MAEYLVLYAVIGIAGYSSYASSAAPAVKKRRAMFVCFVATFVLLGFRHQSMGIDLGYYVNSDVSYLQAFDNIGKQRWSDLFSNSYSYFETGYVLFCKAVGAIYSNRQFFLVVCAFVSLLPIAWVIYKKSENPVLSFVIYLSLPIFEISFSALRQVIAVGICCLSVYYIQEKKLIPFFIAIFVAWLFHKSAWIFLVAYPIYYFKVKRVARFIAIAIVPIVYVARYQLFSIFSKLFKQNAVPDNNGALNFLIMLVLLTLVCSLFYDEDNIHQNGLMNLLLICTVCQVFGNIYLTAQRIGYYFMISLVLLIPAVVNNMEYRLRVIAKVAVIVFFVAFGLYRIYTSTWSMMLPYYWCWELL